MSVIVADDLLRAPMDRGFDRFYNGEREVSCESGQRDGDWSISWPEMQALSSHGKLLQLFLKSLYHCSCSIEIIFIWCCFQFRIKGVDDGNQGTKIQRRSEAEQKTEQKGKASLNSQVKLLLFNSNFQFIYFNNHLVGISSVWWFQVPQPTPSAQQASTRRGKGNAYENDRSRALLIIKPSLFSCFYIDYCTGTAEVTPASRSRPKNHPRKPLRMTIVNQLSKRNQYRIDCNLACFRLTIFNIDAIGKSLHPLLHCVICKFDVDV